MPDKGNIEATEEQSSRLAAFARLRSLKEVLVTFFPLRNAVPSLQVAWGISLLLHMVAFIAVGGLVLLFRSPAPGVSNLLLEFTFAPGANEGNAVLAQADAPAVRQPQPKGDAAEPLPPPPMTEETLPETVTASEPSDLPPMTNGFPNTAESLEPPPPDPRPLLPHEVAAAGPSPLRIPEQPRLRGLPDSPVPATLVMPTKQRQVVSQKIQKTVSRKLEQVIRDTTFTWKAKGQVYTATFHYEPAGSEMGLDEMVVEVSTERNGHSLTTQMRMRRLAFSSFAQFVDVWDPRVAIHDDEFDGRFHSNTAFNISNNRGISPKFRGKVTTAADEVRNIDDVPFFDRESMFPEGIEMGVDVIGLPRSFAVFISPASLKNTLVHHFDEETWVVFQHDGSYVWHTKSQPALVQQRQLPEEPAYFIAHKGAVLHLRGVVNGKVLIYSREKILIDNDLIYAAHPEVSSGADDYLGLVSDKDVEIAHPSVTGTGDLTIHAAILARGRFLVRHLWGRKTATLTVLGSISVGSISATEPRYATKIKFDRRLERYRPPNFPTTNRFEIVDWDGRWQVHLPDSTGAEVDE